MPLLHKLKSNNLTHSTTFPNLSCITYNLPPSLSSQVPKHQKTNQKKYLGRTLPNGSDVHEPSMHQPPIVAGEHTGDLLKCRGKCLPAHEQVYGSFVCTHAGTTRNRASVFNALSMKVSQIPVLREGEKRGGNVHRLPAIY